MTDTVDAEKGGEGIDSPIFNLLEGFVMDLRAAGLPVSLS